MNTQTSDLSHVTVAILAGGLGTRFRSVVKEKPKVLAQVKGHPFLEYILNQLNSAHFKTVILCTGYLSQHIEEKFGHKYKNLRLLYSVEQTPLGTAGSLRKALPLFNSETILAMNGDSFCDVDFEKFWQFHIHKKSTVSLVLSPVLDTSRFGKVILKDDNTVVGFNEKKEENKAGLVSAGIYLMSKSFIEEIQQDTVASLEKDIFPKLVGSEFYGYESNNDFIDIGTPESYAHAQQFFTRYPL